MREIEHTPQTVEGLCGLARRLGYRDPLFQLTNRDGSVVGDLLYFLEDNPGACEAVIGWVSDNRHLWEGPEEEDEEDAEA